VTVAVPTGVYYAASHMTVDRRELPALHELESEVMDVVWDLPSPITVRAVLAEVNSRSGRERAYTTVMTVMRRLDSKGLLARKRDGKTDHYGAACSRREYADARAAAQVLALVDEYGDVALAHFAAEMAKLDPARREQLRELARARG